MSYFSGPSAWQVFKWNVSAVLIAPFAAVAFVAGMVRDAVCGKLRKSKDDATWNDDNLPSDTKTEPARRTG